MTVPADPRGIDERLRARIERVYGEAAAPEILGRLLPMLAPADGDGRLPWDEREVVLITYGDSLRSLGVPPLASLGRFLERYLLGYVSTVHILPFFPYSSDDGFAVIDYRRVNPMLGSWDDIAQIGDRFRLMFDFVLNHVSSRNRWFTDFLARSGPGRDFFVEVDPEADVSGIVRPRVRPLLAGFNTEDGERFVWATFGEDQLDLDFTNPDVLVEMIDVFLDYLRRGAGIVRLDAVAFLWKRLGTACIHLGETHEIVKLFRDVADHVRPGTVVLTETNVPHDENVSYFGASDEAQMVYQFALPPLLLHALFRGTSEFLTAWARDLDDPPPGCTFLNFTASHDGIGMRGAEGILPPAELSLLADGLAGFGAYVSARDLGSGRKAVYEINTTWFDACKGTDAGADELQTERFLASQLMALALRGVPALYIHSLTATPNDLRAVDQTGRLRAINRHRWDAHALERLLEDPGTPQSVCLKALTAALDVRKSVPAFHPDAAQRVLELGSDVFAFERGPWGALEGLVTVIANVTAGTIGIPSRALPEHARRPVRDLLTAESLDLGRDDLRLTPYRVVWLAS